MGASGQQSPVAVSGLRREDNAVHPATRLGVAGDPESTLAVTI